MSDKPRQPIQVEVTGLPPLKVSVLTEVKSGRRFIVLEELEDGTFRLTYSSALASVIRGVEGVRLVQVDEAEG